MLAVVEIIDAFLDGAHKNRERLTYESYKRRLQAFADSSPPSLPYSELKPYHVTRDMDANAEK
jgi:integrase